jgi:hypothetical protein
MSESKGIGTDVLQNFGYTAQFHATPIPKPSLISNDDKRLKSLMTLEGKVCPRTGHEVPEGEQTIVLLFL